MCCGWLSATSIKLRLSMNQHSNYRKFKLRYLTDLVSARLSSKMHFQLSLINSTIMKIHKFNYLISYLERDAARVTCNLEGSSSNYANAWSLLCSRYDNKRVLISQHLDAIFNLQPITRESERSLRFLVDHVIIQQEVCYLH